jgi:proline dehydrogenase
MNVDAEIEKLLAGRWIAGYYAQDAIERTRIFNSHGISTLINFLGEELFDPTKVEKTVSTYVNLIKAIKKNKLDASISLKPTQIGLNISYKLMLSNYLKIAKTAKQNGVFLWLDMEAQDKIDDTIKAYKNAIKYQNTGICIQSYLKRSEADIDDLMSQKAKIRLVKGAYTAKLDTAITRI